MFNGLSVLIVEDEPILALNLAIVIEEFDGQPVGPVPTVSQALALLDSETVDAAILDANLLDRDVTPVAMLLLKRAIPFVIQTAIGLPAELRRDHPHLPILLKPAPPEAVLAMLFEQISRAEALAIARH